MDSAIRDKTWKDLDNRIEEVEETIDRKRKLEAMLRKVTEEQETVPDHIFMKVRDEYQTQLDEILAVLDPLQTDIIEAKKSVSLELKELETEIERTKDSLAEVEFRFKVGEFDGAAFADKQNPLNDSLDEKINSSQTLSDSVARYDSFLDALNSGMETVPPSEPDTLDQSPLSDPEPEPTVQESSEPVAQSTTETEFVDPSEWLDDFETTNEENSDEDNISPRKTDTELFENLLETAPEEIKIKNGTTPSSDKSDTKNPDSSDAIPMLVIKSSTGGEKRIPVLPITLTIGREHDNNIEIKDENAARYHARIVFKNGQYVLESLENSRSTLVNGKQITEAILQDADTITIGQSKMFFMIE